MQYGRFVYGAFFSFAFLAAMPAAVSASPFTVNVDDVGRNKTFDNAQVYDGFGCHGENVSPRVSWTHVPSGTKSIVVTIHDPDAPTAGLGWTHWNVVNISPMTSSIPRGASGDPALLPVGALETLTDFGASRYGGPCPPEGESHRYVITISALSVASIDVKPDASPALVAYLMHGNIIAQARFVARYHRASGKRSQGR